MKKSEKMHRCFEPSVGHLMDFTVRLIKKGPRGRVEAILQFWKYNLLGSPLLPAGKTG